MLMLLSLSSVTVTTAQGPGSFIPIFDGESYQGWEGSKDYFRIEDYAIVAGGMDRSIPKNQFLCTEKVYRDFELKLQVKFHTSDQKNNAGIQIRSARIPNHHEVIGYQADIGFTPSGSVWCGLYDESRRKRFLVEPSAMVQDILKPDGWNDYRIRCMGDHVEFWLNGIKVLDYVEEDETVEPSGVICVQIHSGAPAEAWYKNIKIKEF